MIQTSRQRSFLFGLAALGLIAGSIMLATPARATSSYDGYWNVSITTVAGPCDPTYSVAVQIADGRLNGANGAIIGLVSTNGAVSAQMGGGERRGTASGRLKGNTGSGSWSGTASGSSCHGRWAASRS
jgi:hypothetical protein